MKRRNYWLLGLVLLLSNSIFAQMGTIRGIIIDDETGESLIGVNVVVQ
jgi:hypothetical protein